MRRHRAGTGWTKIRRRRSVPIPIDQIEAEHPGIKGRLGTWIKRADAGDPAFAWLKFCIIRVERSVFIDEVRFRDSLHQRTAIPAAPSRRNATDKAAV